LCRICHSLIINNYVTTVNSINYSQWLASNKASGHAFECGVLCELNLPPNKQVITSTIDGGKAVSVIPDGLADSFILEIKDAKNLSMSDQFRGYFADGRPVNLVVSSKTETISQQLQDAIKNSQGSIRVYNSETKQFTLWKP